MLAVIVGGGAFLLSVSFIGADTSNGTVVVVEDGLTPLVIDGVALVAVRDGERVWVFLGGDRRREPLAWCEVSEVFTTSQGGSIFTVEGKKLAGPSPAPELDRVRVPPAATADHYRIWPDDIIPSKPWPDGTVMSDAWQPRTDGDWVHRFQQPASYCPRPEDLPAQRPG